MSLQPSISDDPRVTAAVDELRALIVGCYPDATFQVTSAQDDATIVHLIAEVDLDDTEELVDLVMERMLAYQVDEGVPIFVIPRRTPERIAARRLAS
jgi:nitrogenase subunit NifH